MDEDTQDSHKGKESSLWEEDSHKRMAHEVVAYVVDHTAAAYADTVVEALVEDNEQEQACACCWLRVVGAEPEDIELAQVIVEKAVVVKLRLYLIAVMAVKNVDFELETEIVTGLEIVEIE